MKLCKHPPESVTADICEGDWPRRAIQWCRICGAYRILTVPLTLDDLIWWRLPERVAGQCKAIIKPQWWQRGPTQCSNVAVDSQFCAKHLPARLGAVPPLAPSGQDEKMPIAEGGQ
jgi:hypothetical protein